VHAVHLAGRARRITATDLNPRALELAALSFALSGIEAELLTGDLFAPVEGRTFDLIVSNPPFVISPDRRFGYRESGLRGDELCRRLVREAPRHLAEDGWCQLLANWLHVDGEDWHERVAGWIDGVDGWVVQRDVQDPAEYAELWLRDSCEAGTPEYRERYDAWLEYFERQKVTGIGFGWISLHRSGGDDVRVEELRHAVDQPVGNYVDNLLRGRPQITPATTLRTAEGVVQEQLGPPGAEDPERIVLRQIHGLRRAAQVGTVEAALAGACDGDLPLAPLLAAIAEIIGQAPDAVRAHAEAVLPDLVADGFFDIIG
jgi:methylase of polypeptide subunit release factors